MMGEAAEGDLAWERIWDWRVTRAVSSGRDEGGPATRCVAAIGADEWVQERGRARTGERRRMA
jgi:hypothetical protein